MSSISGITEEKLLSNDKVRHLMHEGEWYFSVYDLNLEYIGAFKGIKGIKLPMESTLKDIKIHVICIPFSTVLEVAESLKGIPEFNQAINSVFGFNKK